jgi:hypothetical protein
MSTKNKKLRFAFARYHPRVQGLQEISLRYEGENAIIHVRPPDISASGMFIGTSRVLPVGAIVTVECKLVQSGAAIRARGEVRYCLRGVGVGVEFTEIAPQAVRAIEKEIRLGHKRPLTSGGSPAKKRGKRHARKTTPRAN